MIKVTEAKLLEEAKGLLEPGEETEHGEYFRGICELIARCFPSPNGDTGSDSLVVASKLCNRTITKL